MVISNRSGGGEIVSATEDTRFYDDVGCLAAGASVQRPDARVYVRLDGGAMVEAGRAFFARPAGARTPMGSGIVAFRTAAAARAAAPSGPPMTWADVMRLAGERR